MKINIFREWAGRAVWQQFTVTARPVDKRENYIKRCVGIPGDTLLIMDRHFMLNRKPAFNAPNMQFKYDVYTDGSPINPDMIQALDITDGGEVETGHYDLTLTKWKAEKIKGFSNVKKVIVQFMS